MPLFRPTKPRWRVGFNSVVSQGPGAADVPWNSYLEGDDGLWVITFPTVVTVDRGGWYLLKAQLGRASVVVTSSISARLRVNGVNVASSGTSVSTTATQQVQVSTQQSLAAGDQVSLNVTLHGTLTSDFQQASTWMSGSRIGPVAWRG